MNMAVAQTRRLAVSLYARRLTRERCDELTRIPLAGQIESLNVSVATGICLFETRRRWAAVAP